MAESSVRTAQLRRPGASQTSIYPEDGGTLTADPDVYTGQLILKCLISALIMTVKISYRVESSHGLCVSRVKNPSS